MGEYHHEFTLKGTPQILSDVKTLTLTAIVRISGETPALQSSLSKDARISVTPAVLRSMDVEISGSETLSTDAGTPASITFSANVRGLYSDSRTRNLSADSYALSWRTTSTDLASHGLSFSDGTLRVNASAMAGRYEVPITARAVSGEITSSATKTVTITVRNAATLPAVPVLTCTTTNLTLRKGAIFAGLTITSSVTPPGELSNMTYEDVKNTFEDSTNIVLIGSVSNLTQTITRLENLTNIKTLESNQSITKVEINGNETLTTLNLGGSKVETVDAEGCKRLTSINVERAENLTALNVNETAITELNAKDCTRLETVDARGCENLSEVNLEGCENLETLDCSNNSLLMLNESGFKNLRNLEYKHQRTINPLSRLMNLIDLCLDAASLQFQRRTRTAHILRT